MPPFADQLKDDEIAAVINHERSSWGNKSPICAMDKGALGSLVVSGDERSDLFRSLSPETARRHSRH